MPLQKLQFRPGVNRESTTLANEGGWFECDKVRFRSGQPEKIGGWVLDIGVSASELEPPAGAYYGICRSMANWLNLEGSNLLAVGTNLKYYIQAGVNGNLFDITPIRFTTTPGQVTFLATNGSAVITVTDVAHGAQTGDFATFSGAVSLGGNITAAILNAEFELTYLNSDQYTITASVNASAGDTGNGGGAVVGAYQITSGQATYTQNVGWGAGTWSGISTGTPTNALNGAINSSVTTITVNSTNLFAASGNILINSETISYTSKSATQFFGCTRGINGTGSGAAAAHASGSTVLQSTVFTGWGAAASTGIGVQLRLWSQSNYGEDLIFNPRGGALYYWANSNTTGVFNRGRLLGPGATIATKSGTVTVDNYCPSVANIVLVSDASRFVLAFGTNDPTLPSPQNLVQNPMFISWSDQEDFATWLPSATNQAGNYTLSSGSTIISAIQTRQEILVLTDAAVYSMQYLGPPYVWGFQLMGDNISVISPNVVATVNNVVYWMGVDKFYMYSGRLETLPCSLRQYIFDDINITQGYQFFAGTNEGYNEIWWFYCSANSNTVDKYVVFNHLERTWYYGTLARSYWLDSPLRATPMSAGYNGQLIYQENGNDDGTTSPSSPISSYCQSSDFDIGDGHNFGLVTRIIPDVTFDGSTVNNPSLDFAVRPRQFPGTNYGTADAPTVTSAQNYQSQRYYTVQQFTEQVFVRVRGRQMAFRIESNDLGVSWQLGVPRIDIRPDGRR